MQAGAGPCRRRAICRQQTYSHPAVTSTRSSHRHRAFLAVALFSPAISQHCRTPLLTTLTDARKGRDTRGATWAVVLAHVGPLCALSRKTANVTRQQPPRVSNERDNICLLLSYFPGCMIFVVMPTLNTTMPNCARKTL